MDLKPNKEKKHQKTFLLIIGPFNCVPPVPTAPPKSINRREGSTQGFLQHFALAQGIAICLSFVSLLEFKIWSSWFSTQDISFIILIFYGSLLSSHNYDINWLVFTNPYSFLPESTAILLILASLTARCDHLTEFLPVKCEQESHGPFSGLVNRRALMHVFHALSPRQKHRSHMMKTGRHKKEAVAWVSKSQLARKLPAEEHPFRFSVNMKEATSLISN